MTAAAVLVASMIGALIALVIRRRGRARSLPGRTMIISPRRSTVIDEHGAVRSAQSAELLIGESDMERLWLPVNLQNLGRTYWLFLSRVTLGIIRVEYGEDRRSVRLAWPPVTLLRFDPPEYTIQPDRGHVVWRIRDGLLVARSGRDKNGVLAIDVHKLGSPERGRCKLRIEVEVSNFYPAIASGFSMPAYRITQAFIHVLVTHAFLRSLASLDLAQSQLEPFVGANGAGGVAVPVSEASSNGGSGSGEL